MEKLKKGDYSAFQAVIEATLPVKLPDGSERVISAKIERDLSSPDEDTTPHKTYLLEQLRKEAERIERQAREQALFEAQIQAVQSPAPNQTARQDHLYSKVSKLYLEDGQASNRWRPKSFVQVEASLNLFQEFVGDISIAQIDKAIVRDFKSQFLKLPSNRKKKAAYRDKSFHQLVEMDIPEQDRIDVKTVRSNMMRIGAFFSWAKDHGFIDQNPFERLAPQKKRVKASSMRDIFEHNDLKIIFESQEYKNGFLHGSNDWKYWIPIIGLYTGMRLEEICRMRVDWFTIEDSIPTLEIKPDDDWNAKTEAGLRSFAIHPKLIELGLLDLVERQRLNGKDRIFDELTLQRDGYGARVSKWFARYLERLGIKNEKKTFHSLRHTFLNELKQRGVALEVRESIAGHENKSQSESRYGKAYRSKITFDAVSLADFELNHSSPKQ
ncbi:MAG: hypothetical protein Kow0065_16560 [Methylomicrobium sp.]